jgi:hypothetical protein
VEHGEVHYDILAGGEQRRSFTTTDRHIYHRQRRREIQQGTFTPIPYPEDVSVGDFKSTLGIVVE